MPSGRKSPGCSRHTLSSQRSRETPRTRPVLWARSARPMTSITAMDTFLLGVYAPCDIPGRYTYVGGSTTGGAVIYDNGNFLFSHHATDPAGGKLCNAFDLVRLHKFSEQDDDAAPGTPTNRLPSYVAMVRTGRAGQTCLNACSIRRDTRTLQRILRTIRLKTKTRTGSVSCRSLEQPAYLLRPWTIF